MGKLVLDGCWAKIRRAEEHAESIQRQIRAWMDRRPYRIVRQQNPEFTRHSVVVRVSKPPQLERWSLHAGECFHNLRCALDHLVYAIAVYEADADPPPEYRTLAFPLTDSPDDFRSKWFRIKTLSEGVRTEIQALQPYNRPHATLPPLLGVLRDFDDTDKHRLLQMAIAQPVDAEFHNVGYAIEPQESIAVFVHREEIVDGTEIAALVVNRPTPDMDYKLSVTLVIAMKHATGTIGNNRSDVTFLFTELIGEVKAVVDRLQAKASAASLPR